VAPFSANRTHATGSGDATRVPRCVLRDTKSPTNAPWLRSFQHPPRQQPWPSPPAQSPPRSSTSAPTRPCHHASRPMEPSPRRCSMTAAPSCAAGLRRSPRPKPCRPPNGWSRPGSPSAPAARASARGPGAPLVLLGATETRAFAGSLHSAGRPLRPLRDQVRTAAANCRYEERTDSTATPPCAKDVITAWRDNHEKTPSKARSCEALITTPRLFGMPATATGA